MAFALDAERDPRPPRRLGVAGTRVLVAAGDQARRDEIAGFLRGADDVSVVGACRGADLADALARVTTDVVLLDADLRGAAGRAEVGRVVSISARVRVLVLTDVADPVAVLEGLAAGASGYLLLDGAPRRLVRGIHDVMDGRVPLGPELVTAMRERLLLDSPPASPARVLREALTPRELTVLGHLAAGATNADIAAALVLSPGTVKSHVQHVIAKLGVANRTQAAVFAARRGLLVDP